MGPFSIPIYSDAFGAYGFVEKIDSKKKQTRLTLKNIRVHKYLHRGILYQPAAGI